MACATAGHDPNRLLLEAVQQRDLAAVQQQLAAGADVSTTDPQGRTPLHAAAEEHQRKIVAALVAAGADASALVQQPPGCSWQYRGMTPLLILAFAVYRSAEEGWSTRRCPCRLTGATDPGEHGHRHVPKCGKWARVVQQLVAAGARLDAADSARHYTALHYAAEAGCPTLVATLLAAGADPGSSNPEGYTVLHAAARSGSVKVAQQVLGALGPNRAAELVKAEQGQPPLHLAAGTGVMQVVQALLAAGADPEQRSGPLQGAALHCALNSGHFHLVPLLVTPGTVNECFNTENVLTPWLTTCTPLLRVAASRAGGRRQAAAAAKAAAVLLAAGADPSAKGGVGATPAQAAAASGYPEVLQVLLEHEVQQRQQQQQQQQQQAAPAGDTPVLPALLQELGVYALVEGNRHTWRLLLTLAADALGEAGVRSLWGGLKQRLLDPKLVPGLSECAMPAVYSMDCRGSSVLRAWSECWAAACKQLAAQRTNITGRMEQLVIQPHQQQQQEGRQQGACVGASPASKRPKLARELRMLSSANPAAAAAAAAASQDQACVAHTSGPGMSSSGGGSSSSSSRAARAEARRLAAVAKVTRQLEAAAASGDEEGLHAALQQVPNRAQGLSAAVAAASSAGHWGLCMALLRELVMLDEVLAKKVVQHMAVEAQSRLPARVAPQQQQQQQTLEPPLQQQQQEEEDEEEEEEEEEDPLEAARLAEMRLRLKQEGIMRLQAALQVCDALLDDWLALRQQRKRELRDAVVAAVTAAAG